MRYLKVILLFLSPYLLLCQIDPNDPTSGEEAIEASLVQPTIDDGCNNGSITLSINGGYAPYSYLWDYNDSSTSTLSDIGEGVYCVTVTDNLCGEASTCFNLNCVPFSINGEVTPCTSTSFGEIDITIDGEGLGGCS
ncbi:MAG: SprB repeat-containing protein [Saprospiraceae bacterium]|nr:SprB repeat-containing protein [Saprospiraceae bacterium]